MKIKDYATVDKIYNKYKKEILSYKDKNEYRYVTVERDLFGISLPFICDKNDQCWLPVKQVCVRFKLTKSQWSTEVRRMKRDLFLKMESKIMSVVYCDKEDNILYNNETCITAESFLMWIFKMDIMSYGDYGYKEVSSIINKCLNRKILPDEKQFQKNKYYKEKILQTTIKNIGFIDDIFIIGEEVKYKFGRIDLLGKDKYGNKICIELKKDKEFHNTREQLLRYRDSNMFYKVLYIAHEIDVEMRIFLKDNFIDYLTYNIDKNGEINFSK